jgi:hypothetical protein
MFRKYRALRKEIKYIYAQCPACLLFLRHVHHAVFVPFQLFEKVDRMQENLFTLSSSETKWKVEKLIQGLSYLKFSLVLAPNFAHRPINYIR